MHSVNNTHLIATNYEQARSQITNETGVAYKIGVVSALARRLSLNSLTFPAITAGSEEPCMTEIMSMIPPSRTTVPFDDHLIEAAEVIIIVRTLRSPITT